MAHSENIDFQIAQQDNILIVVEVVYNQFCNSMFRQFLQFSWQKSGNIDGYVEGREVEFDTPIKCCFPKRQRNNLPASGLPRSFIHPLFLLFTVVLFRSLYFKQACSSSINFQSVNRNTGCFKIFEYVRIV